MAQGATGLFQARKWIDTVSSATYGRLHKHSFERFHPGPTLHSISGVVSGSRLNVFQNAFLWIYMLDNKKMRCLKGSHMDWILSLGCVSFWTGKIHRLGGDCLCMMRGCNWRRKNLLHDKFTLVLQVWNIFISNCQKTTSHWMTSCCHVRHIANSSSTWPINQISLARSSGWQLTL